MKPFDLRHELLFPEHELVRYANALLAEAGSGLRVHGAFRPRFDRVILLSVTGGRNERLVAPVCEHTLGLISFKSILRGPTDGSWLADGAGGESFEVVAFFGEEAPRLAASRKTVTSFMLSDEAESWQDAEAHAQDVRLSLAERLGRGLYGETFEIRHVKPVKLRMSA